MPKRRSLWSPYSSATTATTTLTADPTTETTTTYSHHHHHHDDEPNDPPLPLPATEPLPSPSDTSARQIREISSRSSIRSWLGLNFASYAVAEDPTSSNRSLSNLSAGRAKSTSSLSGIFAPPSAVAASTFGEFSKPNNVQPAQRVVSVSDSDTKAQSPESITAMNEDSGTTSKRKNRNRTSTPPSVRRPRHSTSNSETLSSGSWIFGEQTPTTTTTSTVTAISVTNPEDPLLATIAPVNHDTARSSAEKIQGETERFMHLRSRSFNDRHSPRTARSSSQGSERNAIDRKSSLLSIAALTTHIMAMRADSPLSPSFSSPSITSGDAKETLAKDATDNQKNESRVAVVPPTPLEAESSEQKVPHTSENRPLSKASSWWWFVSSGSTPNSTALQAQQAPDSALPGNPVLETGSNAASTVHNKKVGEGEEGKVEKTASASDRIEASPQGTQPPPSATPSLLSLKGASELVFGTVAFSRKKAKSETTREGGRETDGAVVARSARADTPELTTSMPETAVIEADSDISRTPTAVSTVSLPSQAAQIAPPAAKVTLPRTANFVLPQLPLPPELGRPPSPRTPPTPSRAPILLPGAPTSILPEHGGDSIVTKALGVLGSMIWSKGEPDGDDGISKKDGNIRKKICEWPKEIRKIAIIGVHGWFPNRLFQRVIGEPTGTSPRFCTDMESAILHHIQTHHPNNPQHPEITLIPLEGEGKVLDRVALLHTALHARPDWVEAVKTADCVFVATHSQGSPVSTILLSKLLSERVDVDGSVTQTSTQPPERRVVPSESNVEAKNTESATDTTESDPKNPPSQPIPEISAALHKPSLLDPDWKHGPSETEEETDYSPGRTLLLDPTRQRIGMLAMAGISHGPFPFLKSNLIVRYLEAEAARELFEFMDCPGEDGSMDSSAAGFEDSSGGSTKREKKKDMELSRTYWKAMRDVLDKGVKVTCVASMADQVVPLYSATMHALSHPNLLRALYIDAPAAQEATSISQTGHKPVPPISVELVPSSDPAAATLEWESSSSPVRSSAATMMERTVSMPTSSTSSPTAKTNLSHFPSNSSLVNEKPGPADLDFLTNLIVFALRLRNAGLSDHGLIVHLSEAVAGSLYGTGHSTIYEEPEVYSLAFKWLLTPKRCSQNSSSPQTPPSDDPSPHTMERGRKKVPANNPKASYTRSSIPARPTAHPETHILGTTPPSRPSLASPKSVSPSNTQPRSTQATQPSPKQTRTRSGLMHSVSLFTPPISESQLEYFTATTHLNPYYLPWIIRALLGDPLVAANEDLALELQGIVRQFKNWEPREKAMRDLKYRLEPLRSHL